MWNKLQGKSSHIGHYASVCDLKGAAPVGMPG